MRPATALSADGPMNLYNAIALAANPDARGRGVLVVADSEIHFAREIEKNNTTRVDRFDSPNRGRAGVIINGQAVLFSPPSSRYGVYSEFSVGHLAQLPRVEIVYSYANFGQGIIDYFVSEGVKGIVLTGVEDGNTTDEALTGLHVAATKLAGTERCHPKECRNR